MIGLLRRYFELQEQIHDHFGYVEDWRVIPIDDQTALHWLLIQREGGSGVVVRSDAPLTRESIESGSAIYSAQIYTQRFLPRWVYRAGGFTMVCADTRTDGNKLLMVFDDAKECADKGLADLYLQLWGNF